MEWDATFVEVDQETLFELILAANYMDLKPLLDLTCAKVASMLKGKTPEQIRKQFNIANDFTPEEEENQKNDAAVRQVTARVNAALPVSGMTPDLRSNAPNPVLALVSGDITTSAIGAHLNQNPNNYKENSDRVWESVGAQFRNIEPPLRETRERRLLGARVEGTGLVASVVYEYDVSGSRVTAIQSILPKGWGSQGRFYNVDRRDGLTVITYQQSEDVLTSLVSRAGEKVIRTLAQESIIP